MWAANMGNTGSSQAKAAFFPYAESYGLPLHAHGSFVVKTQRKDDQCMFNLVEKTASCPQSRPR